MNHFSMRHCASSCRNCSFAGVLNVVVCGRMMRGSRSKSSRKHTSESMLLISTHRKTMFATYVSINGWSNWPDNMSRAEGSSTSDVAKVFSYQHYRTNGPGKGLNPARREPVWPEREISTSRVPHSTTHQSNTRWISSLHLM